MKKHTEVDICWNNGAKKEFFIDFSGSGIRKPQHKAYSKERLDRAKHLLNLFGLRIHAIWTRM